MMAGRYVKVLPQTWIGTQAQINEVMPWKSRFWIIRCRVLWFCDTLPCRPRPSARTTHTD